MKWKVGRLSTAESLSAMSSAFRSIDLTLASAPI
jgi:hypothetical protein